MIGATFAQQSLGGFPLSSVLPEVQNEPLTQVALAKPDYDGIMKANLARESAGISGSYRVATMISTDINLANSGTWSYLQDGSKIWRLTVSVPDAKGLGFLYDHFKLPQGVKLYISNENGRQTLGAYSSENNDPESGHFVNEPVQGATANLEMDIPADIQTTDVVFHISSAVVYYRGVDELKAYAGNPQTTPAKPTGTGEGSSASCNKNANCDLPTYVTGDYTIPKRSSVKVIIYTVTPNDTFAGFCSGTLINNTGNSQNGECKSYVLTASHCDETNSFDNAAFNYWQFRFNFRYTDCNGTTLEGYSTRNGADFKARSNFPSMGTSSNHSLQLVGDFLLLQLKENPPASYNTYLAGWDRGTDFLNDPDAFYIGFHYPHGDVEKLSYSFYVYPDGTFNQNTIQGTHWRINFAVGGTQPGSSGSGLFEKNGLLIGDLSGGDNQGCNNDPQQADFGQNGLYSKIRKDWENEYDQTHFPAHAGAQSRLKDWLDPTNSGAMSVQPMRPDCTPLSVSGIDPRMKNDIRVYPVPSVSGMIHAQTNFSIPTNLQVKVYNPLGRLVKTFNVKGVFKGEYSFDCSDLSDGVYIMKFVSEKSTTAKKIMIAK